MLKENFKKLLMNSIIISAIFLSDRISKIYILKKAELESGVDIYLTPYLNLYLIYSLTLLTPLNSHIYKVTFNLRNSYLRK